jgi:cytochrome b561
MQKRTYSPIFRIMHWAIALCMLFMLLTIFLRLNWMNKNHMAGILLEQLNGLSIDLSEEDAVKIAKQIRKPMWNWHIWIGYVLVGLYILRMILAATKKMIFLNPFQHGLSGKEKFQAWLYVSFYVFIGITLATGFLIVNGPDSIHELMEEIHVLSLYYILTFVFLHIGGVLVADFTDDKGIISRVIGGGKKD